MGKEIKMFLRIEPPSTTFQNKGWKVTKSGRPFQYERSETREVRAKLAAHMAAFRPEVPLKGPIDMSVRYFYTETKSHPSGTFKTTKPDLDNLVKAVLDALNGVAFDDDSKVAEIFAQKLYAPEPYVEVKISSYDQGGIG